MASELLEVLRDIAASLKTLAGNSRPAELHRKRVEAGRKGYAASAGKVVRGEDGKFVPKPPGKTEQTTGQIKNQTLLPAMSRPEIMTGREPGQNVHFLIATYIDSWRKRYKTKERPDLRQAMGVFKVLLKERSVQQLSELVQVYCQMDDKWFVTKHHDIATFSANVGKVAVARDKGHERPNGEKSWIEIVKESEEGGKL